VTTEANRQQGWLQTSLARVAGLMQGQRDLAVVADLIMSELIPLVGAQHGAFFLADSSGNQSELRLIAGYGLAPGDGTAERVLLGHADLDVRRPAARRGPGPGPARPAPRGPRRPQGPRGRRRSPQRLRPN
jgi:GAF domain-containing protein